MSPIQPDDDAIINHLAHGPLHRFADWPNAEVPERRHRDLHRVARRELSTLVSRARRGHRAKSPEASAK